MQNKNEWLRNHEYYDRETYLAKFEEIRKELQKRKIVNRELSEIKNRAKNFEDEIAIKLTGLGTINRLVKTKRGIADIILERKNKRI